MIKSFVLSFSTWLSTTPASAFVLGHSWVWPTAETLHFIGLSMLIGVSFGFSRSSLIARLICSFMEVRIG